MTQRQWYILNRKKKIGPFEKAQVLEMLKNGSVLRSQRIWAEDLENPITTYELFLESIRKYEAALPREKSREEFREEFREEPRGDFDLEMGEQDEQEGPPPLPPMRKKPRQKEETLASEGYEYGQIHEPRGHERGYEKEEFFSPSQSLTSKKTERVQEKVSIHKEIASFKKISGQEIAKLPPLPPDIIRQHQDRKKRGRTLKRALVFLAFLGLLGGLYFIFHDLYYVFGRSFVDRPQALHIRDYDLLKKTQRESREKLKVSLLSSKDGQSLIMATNFIYDAFVEVKLEGQRGKILGNDEILLRGKTFLEGGQALFQNLHFEKGKTITPGYYNVKLQSSQERQKLFWYDRLYRLPQKIVLENISVFLGHLPIRVFNKKLSRFVKKRNKQESEFISDIEQKWATLESLVQQLEKDFSGFIKTLRRRRGAQEERENFERKYSKVYGSFFTEFYLNNGQLLKRLENSHIREKEGFSSEYKSQTSLAKSLGEYSISRIEEVMKIGQGRRVSRQTLQDLVGKTSQELKKYLRQAKEAQKRLEKLTQSLRD